jgi:uncharacterized protein with NAD-binding domain and iron-sulfur cluster
MSKRVAVLGGGVAGLSAAHELVERGFEVVVYEMRSIPGGKARSEPVPGSGQGGHPPLPGEHGFRFFPGFYRHLPDTMSRIPYGTKTVLDNLVATTETEIGRVGQNPIFLPAHFPETTRDLLATFRLFFGDELGIPPQDLRYYVERLLVLLTSCTERRFACYEQVDWWTFSGAATRSKEYQKYCADGLTRTCVAAKAREMSTRTGGYILLQLLFDLAQPGAQVDRVLNGPTNVVWIDPWVKYLRERGVVYRTGAKVIGIQCDGRQITGVTIEENGSQSSVTAPYYIAALPFEVMELLVTNAMKQAEPRLAQLGQLKKAWMNGILFYLDRDVPLVHGHALYIDSFWSLTSISQQQFWPDFKLANCGAGTVHGVLSVDVSNWDAPGLCHKKANQCTSADEIKSEVWEQLKHHLNKHKITLDDANLVQCFLDEDIQFPNPPGVPVNAEPLLINTVGSWQYRPCAKTAIPNLFLASDYVRTYTDLATMESANEAARRAVNAILDAEHSTAKRCTIWPLSEPWIFAPLCWYDRWRFKRGLRHDPSFIAFVLVSFVPLWYLLHLGWQVFRFFQRLLGRRAFGSPRRRAGKPGRRDVNRQNPARA